MKRSFLNTLNYSSSNEDSRSELKALQIAEGDSVLCITGSGGRPLDLLIENPAVIVSIDFDPCQNFLLELKLAAIKHLEYEEFVGFLGVHSSEKREETYNSIRNILSAEARRYWDSNLRMIKKGIIYQGRWERSFRLLARMVSLVRPKLVGKLFSCNDIDEQFKIWHEKWDDRLWRSFLRLISSKIVWKYGLGDPGFYKYVPDNFSIYLYLVNKFNSAFENMVVSKSPFARLLFLGEYDPNRVLPLYLQKINYKKLKNLRTWVQIVTDSFTKYLQNCKSKRFDKYSLSDFSSYTSIEEYRQIWQGIIKTASPGARTCERQFLVKREIPLEIQPYISRDRDLEKELELVDDSIFYTFVIAKVEGRKND